MSAATEIAGLLVATLIDGEALLDTAVASLVAGIVVALTASLAIYGFATASELRRDERDLAAIGAGVIAVAASLAFTATIVLGLIVMIDG